MTTPDWTARLTDPAPIRDVLGMPAPGLDTLSLYCVHIDERDSSVTLTFQTERAPAGPTAEWTGKGHNTLEFSLVFTAVTDLAVDGWAYPSTMGTTLAEHSAVLTGPGSRISFRHQGVAATEVRSFRAGSY